MPASLPGLMSRSDIDVYILILRRDGPVPADPFSGLGIWKIDLMLAATRTMLFANYEVAVVDAHSLVTVAHRSGATGVQNPNSLIFQTVDNAVWPSGEVDALAPDLGANVQQSVKLMMSDSVSETLLELELTGTKREMVNPDLLPTAAGRPVLPVAAH